MAGIGFELRKVYNKGGFLSKQKAYGYAGVAYVGPMLLGILLILAVVILSVLGRLSNTARDHLLGLISYSILASLAITNLFSMIVTRYVADMLYEKKFEKILQNLKKVDPEKFFQYIDEKNIHIKTLLDEDFPEKIRHIHQIPFIIYTL